MCFNPVYKKFIVDDENKKRIIWSSKVQEFEKQDNDVLRLSCNKCNECYQQYSNNWALRIMLEAKSHKDNCFITLTYRDNPYVLNKRDYQLFLKRLRKRLGIKFRYFLCGEYGAKGKRPHYHLVIFGWKPNDLILYKDNLYTSNLVEDVWGLGFVTIGELTIESAKYCAKYMQKANKIAVDGSTGEVVPPFTRMSLKPGIGYYQVNSKIYQTDKIYSSGRTYPIPRYFDKIAERYELVNLENLREQRLIRARLVQSNENQRKLNYEKSKKTLQ